MHQDVVDLPGVEWLKEILSEAVEVVHSIILGQLCLHVAHLSLDVEKGVLYEDDDVVELLRIVWVFVFVPFLLADWDFVPNFKVHSTALE